MNASARYFSCTSQVFDETMLVFCKSGEIVRSFRLEMQFIYKTRPSRFYVYCIVYIKNSSILSSWWPEIDMKSYYWGITRQETSTISSNIKKLSQCSMQYPTTYYVYIFISTLYTIHNTISIVLYMSFFKFLTW